MNRHETVHQAAGLNAEIDELLADVEALGARSTPDEKFCARLLAAVAAAVNADEVAYWCPAVDGLRLAATHPAGIKPLGAAPRRLLAALESDEPRLVALGDESAGARLLVCPVKNAGATAGVIACVLPGAAGGSDAVVRNVLASFAEVAEEHELRRCVNDLQTSVRLARQSQQFTLDLHQARGLAAVTRAVAEEGRRLLGCDRLTVLVRRGNAWRVAAVSGVENPSPRSDAVRGAERLVREAARSGESVAFRDGAPADEHPPALARELQRHVDNGYARELMVLPCRRPVQVDAELDALERDCPAQGRPEAVLLVEQFDGKLPASIEPSAPLLTEHTAVAIDRARHVGPLGGVRRRLSRVGLLGGATRLLAVSAIVVAIAAIAATLMFVPAELRIAAEGRLVPAERSRVFAPMDATVARVLVGHADTVAKGDVLVELRSESLQIELEQAEEAFATTEQEITALETAKLRAGLPGAGQETDVSAVASRIESLRKQTVFQRRRLALLRQQQAKLVVTSPLDGQVVSWRPRDYLAERPVRRGQRLLEVAAVSASDQAAGGWTIEIDVPDRRVGALLTAAAEREVIEVDYVLKASPADAHRGRVRRIASITQANASGMPVVRVEVEPATRNTGSATLDRARRSGSTVLAKIRCGQHSLGYVWFHEAWEAIERAWF